MRIIAEAPPPPLHIDAQPYFPPLNLNTLIRDYTILAPDIPIGCPMATAPPCTFTYLCLIPNNFIFTKGVNENASFISQ